MRTMPRLMGTAASALALVALVVSASPATADCIMEHSAPWKAHDVRGITFLGQVDAFDKEALAYRFAVLRAYAGDVGSTFIVESDPCTPEYRFDVGQRYIFSWAGPRFDESLNTRLEQPSSWDSAAWHIRDDGGVRLHQLGNMDDDRPAFRQADTVREVLALVAPAALPDTSVEPSTLQSDGLPTALLVALGAAVGAWLLSGRLRRNVSP